MSICAIDLNSSPARWLLVPTPPDAKLSVPGCLRASATSSCTLFARTSSRDIARRHSLLRQLFGSIGDRTWVEAPFYCDYGENIRIGSDCFVNASCVFLDCNTITIGSNVLFGPAAQLYTVTHPLAASERLQFDDPEDPARSRYVLDIQVSETGRVRLFPQLLYPGDRHRRTPEGTA